MARAELSAVWVLAIVSFPVETPTARRGVVGRGMARSGKELIKFSL